MDYFVYLCVMLAGKTCWHLLYVFMEVAKDSCLQCKLKDHHVHVSDAFVWGEITIYLHS